MEDWQSQVSTAAYELVTARHVVIFTGAGVSKESGIATFRERDGAWAKYDPRVYATMEGFRRHPEQVWQWYNWRRQEILKAGPNPAHRGLAELEALFPRVVVITQNIDGLHQRAGSSTVLELHGSFQRFRCSADCRGHPTPLPEPPLDLPAPPPCPFCGAPTRPDVVWFGELLPTEVWEQAVEEALQCDAMLVVGTSGVVEPAAALPRLALQHSALVIEVNPEPTPLTPRVPLYLSGPAGTLIPALVAAVRRERAGASGS